ncbi:anti-sigma factor [Paenibacillus sp. KQZ6P-2]|uniref:Regulator of SigK n=1 Tax=Paenibacillus mangrovi TaxID=2931978 RepID=A0A9X1WSV0_9BACL|nr:anti-sigma factor [Paenibacillus mangrovi]MCJ8014454.1 anti-sigma factor [Paenibacillus mangrovi]
MNEKSQSVCELYLDVLSGLCTEEERIAFERHLPGCEACQTEIAELQLVWEGISADMEYIEPPADLKQQVMKAAFTAEGKMAAQPAAETNRRISKPRWLRKVPAAALIGMFLLGTAFNYWLYRERVSITTASETQHVTPSQIKLAVPLQSQSPDDSNASGIACIIDNGKSKQFVVYVYGATPTSGDQAYQVWLIKNGKRSSAGTFRVATEGAGVGVMTMPLESDALAFDQIGITLEPDDKGDQPRGKKMFGSV